MIDVHNHTRFSDGRNTVEEVVQSAAAAKLEVVGVSDHFDPYVSRQDVCLQAEQLDAYLDRIDEVKVEAPLLVLAGLELGLQSTGILWPSRELDYYIYSVHTVPGYPQLRELEDPWTLYLEEAIEAVELIDRPGFLGHLDFLRRHIPGSNPPRPGELIDTLLRKLVLKDVGLEFNTSGWMYGLGDPSPQPWVLERYIEFGGRLITIGSDSHRAADVGRYNLEAVALLKKLSLKEVFYSQNNAYVPISI